MSRLLPSLPGPGRCLYLVQNVFTKENHLAAACRPILPSPEGEVWWRMALGTWAPSPAASQLQNREQQTRA